jgi:hypothetical protein
MKGISQEEIIEMARKFQRIELSSENPHYLDYYEEDIIPLIRDEMKTDDIREFDQFFSDMISNNQLEEIREFYIDEESFNSLDFYIEDLDYFNQEIREKYKILDHKILNENDHGSLLIRLYFSSKETKENYIKDHDMD